jgi:hypothetical protein
MTVQEILALLKQYAALRASAFSRKDFLHWGAHHGLSRRTPSDFIDDAFHEAQAERAIEMIPSTPHPLWRQRQRAAA